MNKSNRFLLILGLIAIAVYFFGAYKATIGAHESITASEEPRDLRRDVSRMELLVAQQIAESKRLIEELERQRHAVAGTDSVVLWLSKDDPRVQPGRGKFEKFRVRTRWVAGDKVGIVIYPADTGWVRQYNVR